MLQHPTSCKANLSQRFTMQGNNTHVESTQRCSGCGNEKPTTAFNRDRTTKTGRKYKCRECSRAMRKRRAQEYAKVEHPDDATKRCPQCQVEKPYAAFEVDKGTKTGRRSWCLECHVPYMQDYCKTPAQREKRKAWYEANREQVLAQARQRWKERGHLYEPARQRWAEENREKQLAYWRDKQAQHITWLAERHGDQPCLDCGNHFQWCAMDFDHVRGVKKQAVSKMSNYRREMVEAEIAKCDLVCANCHRVRTDARRNTSDLPALVAFRARLDPLKEKPCTDCGSTFPVVAMDFDHVRGEKVSSITEMWAGYSWSEVEAEIAKCELVCANCHRVRTHQRLNTH